MVYVNLQLPDGTARRSPVGWWSLTPPSHPYPCGRSFSSSISSCRQLLLFSEVGRPMLPGLSSRTIADASGRPKHCLLSFLRLFLWFFFYVKIDCREFEVVGIEILHIVFAFRLRRVLFSHFEIFLLCIFSFECKYYQANPIGVLLCCEVFVELA